MQLNQLVLLLSLPATILSFVILPEADVFASPPQSPDSSIICPKRIDEAVGDGVTGPSTSAGSRPCICHEAALGEIEVLAEVAAEHIPFADLVEEVVEGPTVQVTRLAPKHANAAQPDGEDADDQPLPVVIWHGLGDSADAAGLQEIAELVDMVHPGTYTYIISVTGTRGSADRQASFFGNVSQQIETVCHLLAEDNILRTAPAIDAIGFSQGGQFLRGYVQRCGSWAPKIRSLLTFGSQHNGIAEFQKCSGTSDWLCQGANALLKSSTVWSDFIQSRLVPAQYYRDLNEYDKYLEHSNFLADINNERKVKNATYAENLAKLDKFVMIVFGDDRTVIPKDSGWFDEVNMTSNSVTKLRDRPIYKEDWIGLKKLDEKGALDFLTLAGEHMQLVDKDLMKLFKSYFGPAGKKFGGTAPLAPDSGKLDL
ncbi:palmitoyl-protein thioesterase [Capronia coronata CBS 617.96]|uniref:Palmitoyl-protein thioesterase 1 n=1 Tax=Capronia coronata CBS 617.96 TaxID=1182541 RepID=W9YM01_9EURO|nr:palmitoyl-protein thioesterase [Capronia coronata CBS 617.96]EXJ90710.1 palmitoyl-protein thioesterase [Capronia coronata CBS 617.96]